MICVNSVKVTPENVTLKAGQWYYNARAEVCPLDAECRSVRWYSNNTGVATVNATTGYIYAVKAGSAKIYAEATDGSGEKDYITVNVTSGPIYVDSVTLSRSSISLEEGENYTLYANVFPSNADNRTIAWSSSNENIAEVSNGIITAKTAGTAYIYARATDGSEKYAQCQVTVTEEVLVTSVSVSPARKTMTVGDTAYLHEIVCPPDADNKEVVWSSSDLSVVTVNYSNGFIMAVKEGVANVYATAADGSGRSGVCEITVEPTVRVQSVEISTEIPETMHVGDVMTLQATVCPMDATNQIITWSSSNENIAEVGMYTGELVIKSAGTVTITATSADGRYTDCCTLLAVQILTYPDTLITDIPTQNTIIKWKNMRDETVNAYLCGTINEDAMEHAVADIDEKINLARADYIIVGENPFSDYAYALFGGYNSTGLPSAFSRNLYYRAEEPFTGLDVIVVQRALELNGNYENETDYNYGTWDQATQEAALSFPLLLSNINNTPIFDNNSYNVLFSKENIAQRTYDAMRMLQQFNLQHKTVQEWCLYSLQKGGQIARIEMPINRGGLGGGTGRADIVSVTAGGTYVWEVKHNTSSAIALGDMQVQRYIAATQTASQSAFYNPENNKESPYLLPLIPGPAVFKPVAMPWYNNKVLLFKSNESLNVYQNALIVYELSDNIPYEYEYVEEPVEITVPDPVPQYSFSFSGVYDALTNFGNVLLKGLRIDPATGEVLVMAVVAGVMCFMALGMIVFA